MIVMAMAGLEVALPVACFSTHLIEHC